MPYPVDTVVTIISDKLKLPVDQIRETLTKLYGSKAILTQKQINTCVRYLVDLDLQFIDQIRDKKQPLKDLGDKDSVITQENLVKLFKYMVFRKPELLFDDLVQMEDDDRFMWCEHANDNIDQILASCCP
jgi:uncharacterized protein (UPF0297 family)